MKERVVKDYKAYLITAYFLLASLSILAGVYLKGLLFVEIYIHPYLKELSPFILFYGISNHISGKKYLGAQWNGLPKLHEDHMLITNGPYQLVRHPIYFSIIIYVMSVFFFIGTYFTLLLVVIASIAVVIKAKLEESLLIDKFGDEYKEYIQRVPFILPIKIKPLLKRRLKGGDEATKKI